MLPGKFEILEGFCYFNETVFAKVLKISETELLLKLNSEEQIIVKGYFLV